MFSLTPVYHELYGSLDLSKNPEVLLYKSYVSGILTHSVIGYTNSSTMMSGLTKDAVDSFLCSDGLPISLSGMYGGNGSISQTLANRDSRLVQSVAGELAYIGNPNEKGFTSSTGYIVTKFNNPGLGPSEVLAPNNPTDAPIFWLAEVMLNYAEASAELGILDQTDLDATINLLKEDSFNDNIEYLNEIIRNEKSLNKAITDFYKNNTKNLECIFMPIKNRYLNYIWSKVYPKIISDKTRMSILAHLQCESHLPRVLYKLKNR
jgi:hypothetical protein